MDDKLIRKDVNHRTPGWYLASRDIELFLTEDGGQHAPVTFRKNTEKPIRPYFISPWQDQRPDLSSVPLLQNLRGDFFCLPFGGNGDPVDGKNYPPHGETAAYRWSPLKAEADGAKTVFEFEMDCAVSGAHVVKRIEMHDGTDAVYLTHTISGFEGKMPYGHHTILEMPEENEKMFFSVGKFDFGMTCPGVFASPVNLEYQYLASGEEFTSLTALPTQFKADPVHDYSVLPSPVGYVDLFAMLRKPNGKPAWATAVYPARGYLFFSLKNADELPSTTVWTSNSGRYAVPWNGNTRCIGIEETCSFFADGCKPSIGENTLTEKGWKTCGTFHKNSTAAIHHIQGIALIPDGFGKVAEVSFEPGKAVFTDEAGKTASAAVDWEFLENR